MVWGVAPETSHVGDVAEVMELIGVDDAAHGLDHTVEDVE
jgi:hypothetical protein